MSYYTRMSRRVAIGVPLVALLAGLGAGWLTRDQATGPRARLSAAVGAPLPEQLDAAVPFSALPSPMTSHVDPTAIIGLSPAPAIEVPAGSVVDLPLAAGATARPVDAVAHTPVSTPPPTPAVVAQPTLIDALPAIADTPSTQPPAETTTTPAPNKGGAVDACLLAPGACAGVAGTVRDDLRPPATGPVALQVSTPFAATGDLAALCGTIEGSTVPDSFLPATTRPTLAVVTNQPSTIALSGSWSDGSELRKLTMVTASAHDDEWQQTLSTQGHQRDILACITIGLDEVRAHATGGRAELRVDAIALSATGRAQSTGEVVINIPVDAEDTLFADRVTITDGGERPGADGVLYPTAHVHYAVLTDAAIPAGSGLTAATAHLYASHAFVEGADCAGWADNQLGRDRTHDADYAVSTQQRTVAGRTRPVTVVDADVRLDPTLPGGWQGYLCVRLVAGNSAGTTSFGLAVQGAGVRSPRAAAYEVGALLDDPAFPADWQLRLMWSVDDVALCTAATLGGTAGVSQGATCATQARTAAAGIVMSFVAVDPRGADHPALAVRVPVNTGYCNLDDPYAAITDGCATGYDQPLVLTYGLPNGGTQQVRVVIHVGRSAGTGSAWQDPSDAWSVGAPEQFAR